MDYIKEVPIEDDAVPKTRRPWSKEEDGFLAQYVNTYGVGHWSMIAGALKDCTGIARTTKQCRNRWLNSLDPAVTKQDWTPEEEELIYTLQKQYGNKWAEIAKHLPGRYAQWVATTCRTDNSVKNHWYSTMRKKLRKLYKFIGDEFNKDAELKREAAEFLQIDYKKYMASQNMKSSDIRIVSYCIDYMQLLDLQGELISKDPDHVGVILPPHARNSCLRWVATMTPFCANPSRRRRMSSTTTSSATCCRHIKRTNKCSLPTRPTYRPATSSPVRIFIAPHV